MKYDINIVETLDNIFNDFDQGNIDGLDVYLYAKKLDEISKSLKSHDEIKEDAWSEIQKYGKGEVCTKQGAEFKTSTRTNYKIDFPYLTVIEEKAKGLKDQAKALLRAGIESSFIPDENGEEQEIKAAIPSYTQIISVSLPKD